MFNLRFDHVMISGLGGREFITNFTSLFGQTSHKWVFYDCKNVHKGFQFFPTTYRSLLFFPISKVSSILLHFVPPNSSTFFPPNFLLQCFFSLSLPIHFKRPWINLLPIIFLLPFNLNILLLLSPFSSLPHPWVRSLVFLSVRFRFFIIEHFLNYYTIPRTTLFISWRYHGVVFHSVARRSKSSCQELLKLWFHWRKQDVDSNLYK